MPESTRSVDELRCVVMELKREVPSAYSKQAHRTVPFSTKTRRKTECCARVSNAGLWYITENVMQHAQRRRRGRIPKLLLSVGAFTYLSGPEHHQIIEIFFRQFRGRFRRGSQLKVQFGCEALINLVLCRGRELLRPLHDICSLEIKSGHFPLEKGAGIQGIECLVKYFARTVSMFCRIPGF